MAGNPAGKAREKREIPSLTGLRGVAALCVVFSHFWFWTSVTPVNQLPTTAWVDTSTIGMAIFFTLSGYVIALSYSHWDWRGRPAYSLLKLFFYRFARLYPAFLLFALIVVLRVADLQDWRDGDVQHYVGVHLLLLQSWLPVKFGGVLSPDDHFHVSWSLSVECALYLLFGLGAVLVAVLPAWRGRAATLGIAFFVVVVAGLWLGWSLRDILRPADFDNSTYYRWIFLFSPAAISLQFGIGVAAWKVSTRIAPSVASMASNCGLIGLVAVHVLLSTRLLAGGESREGVFTAMVTALLLVGSSADSIANRFLSTRPLLFLGTISYSLYLFHFLAPPMALHGHHHATYDATAIAWHAVNFAASLGLAILLATGAYVLVETPGRRLIRAGADRLLAALSASSMAEAQPRAEQARSS